jgi:glucokinase
VNRLAIDIGGTKFALALFSAGRMTRRAVYPTHRQAGRERLLADLAPLLRDWRAQAGIAACGVGFGGPVDFAAQRVARSTHAPGWGGFQLRDYLQDLLGAPAVVDNDANCGALGEALYGAGRGARPLFYMTLSTGIGGGLVLHDDRVYRGADSWAGEIGHLTVRPDGPECLCGAHGCLERLCSGLWLERDHGRAPRELFQDPAFAARYARDLALGVKAAIMLLNPARVVIGGGLARAGERLFAPLRAELARQITAWSGARVDVRAAELADDSVLWGAYFLASAAVG